MYRLCISLLGICLLVSFQKAHSECLPLSLTQAKAIAQEKGSIELVFFASWCSSCAPHLKNKDDENVLFVAAFDKPERAERVLKKYRPEAKCYFEQDITNTLGIITLPTSYIIKKEEK